MGLDYGLVHVGVALSDPEKIIGSAFTVLEAKPGIMEALAEIIRTQDIEKIIVGLPKNKDGSLGPAAQRAKNFAQALKQKFNLPIAFMDERFTTKAGEAVLKEQGVSWHKSKGMKDKLAAALILQTFLDRNRGER